MTETSSLQESSRENSVWWKLFMTSAYENHSRAVVPKIRCRERNNLRKIVKRDRMPALKDRI